MSAITVLSKSVDAVFHATLRTVLDHHKSISSLDGNCDGEAQLLRAVRELKPDVLLIDGPFRGDDRLPLLTRIAAVNPGTKTILFCDYFDHHEIVEAILHGAKGCIMKNSAPEQWIKAIHLIHNGDIWFDRKLLMAALDGLSHQALRKHHPPESKPEILTEREWEVVCWVGQGMTNKEVARQLDIGKSSIYRYLKEMEAAGI